MKGISAIIVVVLLLLISIALISVVFIWSSGLLTTTTSSVSESTTKSTTTMQKVISIIAAKCTNTTPSNNVINFTIQNAGAVDIESGDMHVFVDEEAVSSSPDISATALAKGETATYGVETTDHKDSRTLKITSPSFTMEKTLTC